MAAAYTPQQTLELLKMYENDPSEATIRKASVKFNKTERSIVAKLSKEGVYIKKVKRDKTGQPIEKKDEIVQKIESILNLQTGDLEGLEKSPKLILKKLRTAILDQIEQANEKPEWLEFINRKNE